MSSSSCFSFDQILIDDGICADGYFPSSVRVTFSGVEWDYACHPSPGLPCWSGDNGRPDSVEPNFVKLLSGRLGSYCLLGGAAGFGHQPAYGGPGLGGVENSFSLNNYAYIKPNPSVPDPPNPCSGAAVPPIDGPGITTSNGANIYVAKFALAGGGSSWFVWAGFRAADGHLGDANYFFGRADIPSCDRAFQVRNSSPGIAQCFPLGNPFAPTDTSLSMSKGGSALVELCC